jgi:hypothetical protein
MNGCPAEDSPRGRGKPGSEVLSYLRTHQDAVGPYMRMGEFVGIIILKTYFLLTAVNHLQ